MELEEENNDANITVDDEDLKEEVVEHIDVIETNAPLEVNAQLMKIIPEEYMNILLDTRYDNIPQINIDIVYIEYILSNYFFLIPIINNNTGYSINFNSLYKILVYDHKYLEFRIKSKKENLFLFDNITKEEAAKQSKGHIRKKISKKKK